MSGRVRHALLLLVLVAGSAGSTLAQPSSAAAPACSTTSRTSAPWTRGSVGRRARLGPSRRGCGGRALRLDFDLAGTAGYALARRALPLELPANYEIVFSIRGDAPANHFQVKLVDASGENVWWFSRPDFEFPARMATRPDQEAPDRVRVGPDQGPHAAAARRPSSSWWRPVGAAGKGRVEVSGLVLRELPDRRPPAAAASGIGVVLGCPAPRPRWRWTAP